MAGGVGSRFWPMSTQKYPKQFQDILGTGHTMIQQTYNRISKIVPPENIYVITSKEYIALTEQQLPELNPENIVGEPMMKNTAACNIYMAKKIAAKNPSANLIVLPADHLILNETVFILKSNGTFYEFPLSDATKDELKDVKEWKKILPMGEYESLYANDQTNQLYVLCKNSKEDKRAEIMSGFIFTYDPTTHQLISSGKFSMDLSKLIENETILRTGLKASALTRDPHTGEWYILSAVNKLLVVATPDWKVKSIHRLNSSIFNQPEGLAFDEDMNLYISNEGDELTSGNILKFKIKL